MQALTSTVCKGASVGTTSLLTDTRDSKQYWVTKLKDNNCWMTQNLDYDGSGTKVTDLAKWSASGNSDYQAFYDPGDMIRLHNASLVNIPADLHPSTDPGDNSLINYAAQTYNSHYHLGNYYSFNSATNGAGSGVTSGNVDPTKSICPTDGTSTGWQLPTQARFGTLINSLGDNNDKTAWINAIQADPYYFLMSGYVSGVNLSNAGTLGYYWSSTTYGNKAFALDFYGSVVAPSASDVRYFGLSVRCLVIGS